MRTIPLSKCVEIARQITSEAANMKDYRVRSKKLFAGRETARNVMKKKGYVIFRGKIHAYGYNQSIKDFQWIPIS